MHPMGCNVSEWCDRWVHRMSGATNGCPGSVWTIGWPLSREGDAAAGPRGTCGRAREEDAANVYRYTGTLRADSQLTSVRPGMEEDAASVARCGSYEQTVKSSEQV